MESQREMVERETTGNRHATTFCAMWCDQKAAHEQALAERIQAACEGLFLLDAPEAQQ